MGTYIVKLKPTNKNSIGDKILGMFEGNIVDIALNLSEKISLLDEQHITLSFKKIQPKEIVNFNEDLKKKVTILMEGHDPEEIERDIEYVEDDERLLIDRKGNQINIDFNPDGEDGRDFEFIKNKFNDEDIGKIRYLIEKGLL